MGEGAHPAWSASKRRRVEELIAATQTMQANATAIMPAMLPALTELIGFDLACAYRPVLTATGFRLSDVVMVGPVAPEAVQAAHAAETHEGRALAAFDPLRPAMNQRNRALEPKATLPRDQVDSTVMARVQRRLGIFGLQELRVVVCARRSSLAWVGGYRDGPFEPGDAAILEALTLPLARRLAVEAQLRVGPQASIFEAVLEATDAPALVVRRRDDDVVHANAAGRAWLEAQPGGKPTRRALQQDCVTMPLQISAAPDHAIVTVAPAARTAAKSRTRAAEWRLSARGGSILAQLVAGDSNATIAAEQGVTLRTVERHVRRIMRHAGVDTRAELVAAALRL